MAVPNDRRAPLSPPRFGLRTLLLVVGVLCILIGIVTSLDGYGAFAAIMLVLSIVAHFVGAAIGHQLRDHGSQPINDPKAPTFEERYRAVQPAEFAPATRLSRRRGPGKLILAMTIAWAVLGAIGGAVLLYFLNGSRSNLVNLSSGAAAFAVLGAIWGFALASFLQEILSALFEAHKVK